MSWRYVARICMNVAKVDRDVAYVVMVIHVCCKHLFLMFYLFFQTYIANVFIWMLHMFYAYVARVLSRRCVCVAIVFECFFTCFYKCFTHMF
jgi:hypothetical protein